MHPGYNSTAYAKSLGLPVIEVQHHFAHIASCMAENALDCEVIGVAFDGAGFGSDGTIWGGEFLKVSYAGYERLGSISPYKLAGGDAAAREGYRSAIGILSSTCGTENARKLSQEIGLCSAEQFSVQAGLIKNGINCVDATSVGRLFDAVSAIIGLKHFSSYEGEAAVALECAARSYSQDIKDCLDLPDCDTNGIIALIAQKSLAGESKAQLAYYFHAALAKKVADCCNFCRKKTHINHVVLSGGVFANRLLLKMCENRLTNDGFEVFCHNMVPCTDGGIALGQAAIALYTNSKSNC
jgi:hydrogenase maturation protein HypF